MTAQRNDPGPPAGRPIGEREAVRVEPFPTF